MNNDPVVISMGGSVMIPDRPSPDFIREFAGILKATNKKVFVVIGGGKLARNYILIARELGCDEGYLDEIGIHATRLNARLLIAALGKDAYPIPAKDFDEAIMAGRNFQVVIMGGTHPGHTTDGVAAMLAERMQAERLIIATNVKGVYTSDPKTNPDARLFRKMPSSRLLDIAHSMERGAGKSGVADPLAARLIVRTGIPTLVCDGREPGIVEKSINAPLDELEKAFEGTLIQKESKTVMEVE
ncbi:MAG: UMP kinase [Thermoplasmata archaeon]|nr:UMP kinase [Thermoplasmata archaeon]